MTDQQTTAAQDVGETDSERISREAAEAVARHDADAAFLRQCGQALETEANRRRSEAQPSMTPADAAAIVAALVVEAQPA